MRTFVNLRTLSALVASLLLMTLFACDGGGPIQSEDVAKGIPEAMSTQKPLASVQKPLAMNIMGDFGYDTRPRAEERLFAYGELPQAQGGYGMYFTTHEATFYYQCLAVRCGFTLLPRFISPWWSLPDAATPSGTSTMQVKVTWYQDSPFTTLAATGTS